MREMAFLVVCVCMCCKASQRTAQQIPLAHAPKRAHLQYPVLNDVQITTTLDYSHYATIFGRYRATLTDFLIVRLRRLSVLILAHSAPPCPHQGYAPIKAPSAERGCSERIKDIDNSPVVTQILLRPSSNTLTTKGTPCVSILTVFRQRGMERA